MRAGTVVQSVWTSSGRFRQVEDCGANFGERRSEGGTRGSVDGHLVAALRLAAVEAEPLDGVRTCFDVHAERLATVARLQDEVVDAGVSERVAGRAEITARMHVCQPDSPRVAEGVAHRVAHRLELLVARVARGVH